MKFLRAGAFKPRTSPYAFQGMGLEGLKILAKARERTGIGIVTELMDTEYADAVEEPADVIQIGTRNMQNFSLLKRVGKCRKPVLLKRGMSATLEEWLMAAEYVMAGGNYQVILCERGVRTFSDHSRNTLDLSVIPPAKALSHLPIFVDPSHGTGKRAYVPAMALAALAAGADGILVEAHPEPDKAMSDGAQSLDFPGLEALLGRLKAARAARGAGDVIAARLSLISQHQGQDVAAFCLLSGLPDIRCARYPRAARLRHRNGRTRARCNGRRRRHVGRAAARAIRPHRPAAVVGHRAHLHGGRGVVLLPQLGRRGLVNLTSSASPRRP